MRKLYARLLALALASPIACTPKPSVEETVSASDSETLYKKHQGHMHKTYTGTGMPPASECLAEDASPEKKKSFASVRKVCAAEIERLCKETECPELMKPVQVCLMMEAAELGAACKKEINRHIQAHQPYVRALE